MLETKWGLSLPHNLQLQREIDAGLHQRSGFQQRLQYRLDEAGIKPTGELLTDQDRQEQYDRILALTDNTPITRHENRNGLILMKRLSQNLSECHYDRAYLETLRFLEEQGVIWPRNRNHEHGDQKVELVELSSGSAGISFGLATRLMGFDGTLYVPEELEQPRVQVMRSLGLNLVITPPGYVKAAAKSYGERIAELKEQGYKSVRFERGDNGILVYEKGDHRVVFVNHSENIITVNAFGRVGEEMADFLPPGIHPDYFLTILGNFTSTVGIARALREKHPKVKIIGIEDITNPDRFDLKYPGRFVARYGRVPNFDRPPTIYGSSQRGVNVRFLEEGLEMLDDIVLVDPDETRDYQAEYNGQKGRYAADSIGRSTASSLLVAEALVRSDPASLVYLLNYDKGDRYERFVPEHSAVTMTMGFLDAGAFHTFDTRRIQPPGYRQPKPEVPTDIPVDLLDAYSNAA